MSLILRTNLRLIAGCTALINFFVYAPFSHSLERAKPELQGLVEQRPIFDTSLSIKPFQIGIEHKETIRSLRKNKTILRSKESLDVLRREARAFKLETSEHLVDLLKAQSAKADKALQSQLDAKSNMLKGKVGRDGKPFQTGTDLTATALQAKLDQERKALKGRVDQSGKPLIANVDINRAALKTRADESTPMEAMVTEPARSPLKTVERIRPTFKFDLRKLTADVAPDLAYKLDEELEQSHIKSAGEVARQQKAMEQELHARNPKVDMPSAQPKVKVDLGLTKAIESKMKEAEKLAREKVEQMRIALSPKSPSPKMPVIPGPTPVPKFGLPPGKGSSDSAVKESMRAMDNEFAKINQKAPSTTDMDQEQAGAKIKSRIALRSAEPGVNAILTHAHYVPQKDVPAVPSVSLQGSSSETLSWDAWHARFAELAKGPILAKVRSAKNTSGFNTVEITVFRDHRVEVKIAKSSNEFFDRATIEAYRSLSGNLNLEFPANSKRESISFLVDNEHKGAGAPSEVQSRSGTGDKEVIQRGF